MQLIAPLCLALLAAPVLADDFRPLPMAQVAQAIDARYHGRLLSARLDAPCPDEAALGAALVYEARLLTPARDLLLICIDARDGRFLDVAGRGQTEARK